ncbi:hypothetical protein LINGRAHAP2_LOCUS5218 [Linum grandiflorum]
MFHEECTITLQDVVNAVYMEYEKDIN